MRKRVVRWVEGGAVESGAVKYSAMGGGRSTIRSRMVRWRIMRWVEGGRSSNEGRISEIRRV